ncbi:MAG: hypothetical protein KDJ36_00040 [Hyphomicrobiaceae bacterium]|nr:hypothetical protein [Hyphomicrobiaceae bacterium]
MTPNSPSSNMAMFNAILFWLLAWWLVEIAGNDGVIIATAAFMALIGLGLAITSVKQSVASPSPFPGPTGQLLWALRPRKWMIAWGLIVVMIAILGRPMFLWNYGGGRCQYIDWWLRAHVLHAQGDGVFSGCRFLAAW